MTTWREQENVRWSLRNFSILPSLQIARGDRTHELSRGPAHDVEAFAFDFNGQTVSMANSMAGEIMDGYLVIKSGEIVYERYFDNFKSHDHHLWASATKSLISTAIGIAVEEFGIDENKSSADYIPELEGSAFGDISIRQVLNMVSAIDYSEDYHNLTPGSTHLEYFQRIGLIVNFDILSESSSQSPRGKGVRGILPRLRSEEGVMPGTTFNYQSPNVDVIGWLLEKISDVPLRDYIQSRIWAPLQTEHDAFVTVDPGFDPVSTGGMNTTLRDAARFGLAALGDGNYAGEQIFPQTWMKDTYTLTEADLSAGQASVFCNPDDERYTNGFTGYRSFWWNHDHTIGERMAMGVHGQVIYINKEKDVVIACFASPFETSNVLRPSFKQLLAGTKALARSL